jgi:glycosyltransferase involved in cell wall biosynthesis
VSVINDLSTDQRVHKHCLLLQEFGYDVQLVGRHTSTSRPLEQRTYTTVRMRLPFERGPLFYASYNLALFFRLLFSNADLLFSNDLDTLLPNFLVSRLKRKNLVYDSHEYFTEVPELVSRPKVKAIWKRIESWILPNLQHTLTVNNSISQLYRDEYGVEMGVLRNVPKLEELKSRTREELGLPLDKRIVILQGSGINIQRGAEEAVEAMLYVENAVLLIIGSGDVIDVLKHDTKRLAIEEKVIFKGRMPYSEMMAYTQVADLGLTLDKDTNVNYRYSLPNKLFDYIHAGIPVLGSNLVEVKNIIEEFGVGKVVDSVDARSVAQAITDMLNSDLIPQWKLNCSSARNVLNWQTESQVLRKMIVEIDG